MTLFPKSLVLAGLIFFFGLSCLPQKGQVSRDVVAKINGENVDINEYLIYFNAFKNNPTSDPSLFVEAAKKRALEELIVQTLLRQETAKRHISVAPEEIETRLQNWKDSYPPNGFQGMLLRRHTTEAALRKKIEEELVVEKVCSTLFGTELLISDDEVKNYYAHHESEFVEKRKVHIHQILVPTKEEAEKIKQEILSEKLTFESAARQYSLSPDAVNGGDMGYVKKGEKVDVFDQAFQLQNGMISEPLKSPYGYHLIKVDEKVPGKKLQFGEAKGEVTQLLKQKKEVEVYKSWMNKLLRNSEVYVNETALRRVL